MSEVFPSLFLVLLLFSKDSLVYVIWNLRFFSSFCPEGLEFLLLKFLSFTFVHAQHCELADIIDGLHELILGFLGFAHFLIIKPWNNWD